ncbi:MAG: epoxyqueuosine reductase [Fretibacterium sp.]|nr:epoxyqueuosine reductase [Fretibacterium sp.]
MAVSVISYFVPFTKPVARFTRESGQIPAIWGEAYAVINPYFDEVNSAIKGYLEDKGFPSFTIAATHTYNEADMKSMWSHRSAAAIAGLGTFGANRMLITPRGAAGRFSTVLTAARLTPTPPVAEEMCPYKRDGSCGLCFKICPVHALHSDGIDRFACQAETRKNEKLIKESTGLSQADVCGKCISVCPYAYID